MKKILSKLLALVMLLVMTFPTASANYSGDCGDFAAWELREGRLVISGSGCVASAPWLDYRDAIVTAQVELGITSLPEGALRDCCNLRTVSLSRTVSYIGGGAFENCPALEGITVDPNNRYYHSDEQGVLISGGASETIVHAPALLGQFYTVRTERVGEGAFSDCKGLRCVKINWAASIGDDAFRGCKSLERVVFGAQTPVFGDNVFADTDPLRVYCYGDSPADAFPEGTEFIKIAEGGACGEKTDPYTYSDEVQWLATEEGDLLIYGQGRMADYGGGSVTPPWSRWFQVKRAEVAEGVEYLGDRAFYDCYKLEAVTLPRDIRMGSAVFYECQSLNSVVLPKSMDNIGYETFYNCKALTQIIIPDTVTEIEEYAFAGCSNLKYLTVPAGVTKIGEMAFQYCTSLKEVNFLGSRPEIAENAFCHDDFTACYPANDDTWDGIENTVFRLAVVTWRPEETHIDKPRPVGDIDGDMAVTNRDIVILARHLVGIFSGDAEQYGDMDGNGTVDNADIVIMARVLVEP